jgi:hypothetical protein
MAHLGVSFFCIVFYYFLLCSKLQISRTKICFLKLCSDDLESLKKN